MNFDLKTLPPALRSIHDYWLGLCPDQNSFPASKNISPHDLKPYLPYIALVEKRPPDGDYYYRLVGTGITAIAGYDATGKRVSSPMDGSRMPLYVQQLTDAIERAENTRSPVVSIVTYEAEDTVRKFQRMVLPLADDGTTINMFICYNDLLEV